MQIRKKQKLAAPSAIRVSPEDEKIVAALIKKKGGSFTSVTREAWRVMAAKEEQADRTNDPQTKGHGSRAQH